MQSHLHNWYQLLVDQSKTDHIYDLIHEGLSHDFNPQDPQGFVLIHPQNLPAQLQPLNPQHVVQNAENVVPPLAMLKNNCLTDYLEAGWPFEIIELGGYSYALLHFPLPKEASDELAHAPENDKPELSNKQPEEIFDDDDPLLFCYELIKQGENRELALQLAQEGQQVLEQKIAEIIQTDKGMVELLRVCTGFNILAIAYAWNNRWDRVKVCDSYYIHNPIFKFMQHVIAPYLELLIAKKQGEYLQSLFANHAFRESYLPHYEAYISLLENPHYECKRMKEMIPIINRINNGMDRYI